MDAIHERILIIDDHEASARTLAVALSRRGHACQIAASAATAVVLVASFRPTVVLLEWPLRSEPGEGLADMLRRVAYRAGCSITVIALSHRDVPLGFSERVDAYLTKPVQIETIEREISVHIRRPS